MLLLRFEACPELFFLSVIFRIRVNMWYLIYKKIKHDALWDYTSIFCWVRLKLCQKIYFVVVSSCIRILYTCIRIQNLLKIFKTDYLYSDIVMLYSGTTLLSTHVLGYNNVVSRYIFSLSTKNIFLKA